MTAVDVDRTKTADALAQLLADSYTLYLKTQNYHWNVTGPHFGELHAIFELQYTDLALAVDLIAERLRALNAPAPGSFAEFGARTAIPEAAPGKTAAMDMVAHLAKDNLALAAAAAHVIRVADEAGDEPTAGMATDRQQIHEKSAWMLRSFLE